MPISLFRGGVSFINGKAQYEFAVSAIWHIPYSLDQTPRLLFISSPEFVRRLFESGDYSREAFINTYSCQRGNP